MDTLIQINKKSDIIISIIYLYIIIIIIFLYFNQISNNVIEISHYFGSIANIFLIRRKYLSEFFFVFYGYI